MGPLDLVAMLSDLFISSQHFSSNLEGEGHQKGSDASREPCPSLMGVNSRQMGSMDARLFPYSLPPTRAAKILVLIRYMWNKKRHGWCYGYKNFMPSLPTLMLHPQAPKLDFNILESK